MNICCFNKVFTKLHVFHTVLCYSLTPKCNKLIYFHKILHTNSTLWQRGKLYWVICQFNKNGKPINHIYVSLHNCCLILYWSTFGSNYSLRCFWIGCQKLISSTFRQFCPFCFVVLLKLCYIEWEPYVAVFSSRQRWCKEVNSGLDHQA